MEAYVILTSAGAFFRVEHNNLRADNFALSGYRVEKIQLQKTSTGYTGENASGKLTIAAGLKEWTSKSQSSKRIDRSKDDE